MKLESVPYETALRMCMLDAKSILEAYLQNKLYEQYGSNRGQIRTLIHDMRSLYYREDCPNYNYKKGTP